MVQDIDKTLLTSSYYQDEIPEQRKRRRGWRLPIRHGIPLPKRGDGRTPFIKSSDDRR
jgi:hypothetical protein